MKACLVVALLAAWISVAPMSAAAEADAPKRPRIGLVLSGGGARGAAHIGVLKVLEEMRVPIDFIAGTSMGAIVGASYASGTNTVEMEDVVRGITTTDLYKEELPRQDRTIHRKKEDADLFIGPELGLRDGELRLPKGVVSGIRLESVLRRLSKAQGFQRFDDLPIPFRAVATDIGSGEMVVFDHGELARVMRASMSVPGAIAPAQIEGRVLLDGGLTRNLPVDVARAMGADVIIAVDLGTPLLKQDEVTSIVGVTTQMIAIMAKQNVHASLASLTADDILISPELGNYSASDFDHMTDTIPVGEAAARKMADKLAHYSLPPEQYARLRASQVAIALPNLPAVDAIRFDGLKAVNPAVLEAAMETRPGEEIDEQVLDNDIRRLYGRGDFEHINYRVIEEAGRRVLTVEALEKSWGPSYLRFGLGLVSDFQGEAYFNVGARYRKQWINSLGAEWRLDGQIGRVNRLASELYQPLDVSGLFFVAPYFDVERRPFDLFAGSDRVARFNFSTNDVGLDFGSAISKWAEIRLGVVRRRVRTSLDTGLPIFTNDDVRQTALHGQLLFDQLDSLDFPRRGVAASLDLYSPRRGDGERYTKYYADALGAYTRGRHTLQLGVEGGGTFSGQLPDIDLIQFGGFQQLSGYRTGQLLGTSLAFGRLAYLYRLHDLPLLEGVYTGVSLEAGRLSHVPITGSPEGLLVSGSVFLGLDTPLGPLYLAYGRARDGNSSAYLFLGRP